MIGWAISHNHEIGIFAAGILVGIIFAAWRQGRIEDERWIARMRDGYTRRPIAAEEWGGSYNVVTFPTATADHLPRGFPLDDDGLM